MKLRDLKDKKIFAKFKKEKAKSRNRKTPDASNLTNYANHDGMVGYQGGLTFKAFIDQGVWR